MTIGMGNSANRETELRLGAKGQRVFTVAGWNKVLRDAGVASGNWWIANYGVLRFRGPPVYQHGTYYGSFYDTGTLMANFNSRARTQAVATKGRARFWIVVPFGHPVQQFLSDSFRYVSPRESKAVAREYRRAVIQGLQTGRVAHAAKQQARADRQAAINARKAARASRRTRAIPQAA